MRPLLTLVVAATASFAQATQTQSGSISGIITDAATRAPFLGLTVTATSVVAKQLTTQTDAQGRYRLPDLTPGAYFLNITGAEISSTSSRDVPVKPGQDVKADFALEIAARVSGRVTDWEKKPVPKTTVVLVEELYRQGAVTHSLAMSTLTDEEGRYQIEMVKPGRRYAVMARPFKDPTRSPSNTPPDPDHREPVAVPTFLPGTESVEGAQTIELRSGQQMEAVDIQLARERPWCVSGTLELPNAPGPYMFEISDSLSPSFAGRRNLIPGMTRDGRFRVCELTRGQYSLTSISRIEQTASFWVIDKDVTGLKVAWPGAIAVPVEVLWEADDTGDHAGPKKGIVVGIAGRVIHATRDRFTVPDIPIGAHPVDISGLETGWYVKEIRYGGTEVLHQTVHVGSATGDLRIVLAHDAGTLTAIVTGSDGQPLPAETVWVMPLSAASALEMEEALASGTTDDHGSCSLTLPPGKYRILATRERFDHTASHMDRLWAAHLRGKEIDLPAKGSAQIRLELTPVN